MTQVGVLGASGYVGAELLRLLAVHPQFKLAFAGADTAAGEAIAELYPNLSGDYADWEFAAAPGPDSGPASGPAPGSDKFDYSQVDLVFLALPHGVSQRIVPDLPDKLKVIDLAADFRLDSGEVFAQWYGQEHSSPQYLSQFSYGLPELFGEQLSGDQLATKVAVPGCYPTAAALALTPLVRAGLISTQGIIVDAASGVSGAGRAASANTAFCHVDENFSAYGLCTHRHTPEMEQAIGAQVLFTPHLAPMSRGILATCYAQPGDGAGAGGAGAGGAATGGATGNAHPTTESLLECLARAYEGQPFVHVSQNSPQTKATYGSNSAHLTARFDERTGTVISICALDNLGKGAAGQAIQCANIICGLAPETGLPIAGMYP